MKRFISVGAVLIASTLLGFLLAYRDQSRTLLDFLSVGQGDCAVFTTGGRTILIDTGPADEHSDAGEEVVLPKLRELGIDGVDAILLSHPDSDHVGGTGALLRAFPAAKVFASDCFQNDAAMLKHLATWNLPADRVVWLPEETLMTIGPWRLRLSCPRKAPRDPANNGSMFVHLVLHGASATFSGDAPKETEVQEESSGDWRAEIVKLGHHGSKTASDESWLRAVRPTFAIVSVGINNRYGHPNREVLNRCEDDGIRALRTDLLGDLPFAYDGQTFRLAR